MAFRRSIGSASGSGLGSSATRASASSWAARFFARASARARAFAARAAFHSAQVARVGTYSRTQRTTSAPGTAIDPVQASVAVPVRHQSGPRSARTPTPSGPPDTAASSAITAAQPIAASAASTAVSPQPQAGRGAPLPGRRAAATAVSQATDAPARDPGQPVQRPVRALRGQRRDQGEVRQLGVGGDAERGDHAAAPGRETGADPVRRAPHDGVRQQRQADQQHREAALPHVAELEERQLYGSGVAQHRDRGEQRAAAEQHQEPAGPGAARGEQPAPSAPASAQPRRAADGARRQRRGAGDPAQRGLRPRAQTPNPKPQTPNPKPQTPLCCEE